MRYRAYPREQRWFDRVRTELRYRWSRAVAWLTRYEPPQCYVVREGGTFTGQARQDWRRRLDAREDVRQYWRYHDEVVKDGADLRRRDAASA